MKCRNIYTGNNIPLSSGVLFGPIALSNQYETIKINNYLDCIRSLNDEQQELSYLDINENKLYSDVLRYGNDLYEILKDNLLPINIQKLSSREYNGIISSNDINEHLNTIYPICLKFIENYGFPFSIDDTEILNNDIFYHLNKMCYNIVPIISIVRYILVIYMLHQVLYSLDDIKETHPQIYNCLFEDYENTNLDMLETLVKYISSYNNFLNNGSTYKIKIIENDSGNLTPIRYTTNLFTFAFEAFTNCLCTLSFKECEADNTYSYTSFRKCQKCFKNIIDEPNVDTIDERIPLNKSYICDDCKKESKRESSRLYERTLRELYDKLKSNIDNCSPKLANEIKHLKPKDKETKKHLKELYSEYLNDIQKKE